MVDRLGGVPADDRDVVTVMTATGEVERGDPCFLVALRRQARLVPGAAVHARVPRQELGDASGDGGQRVGRRRRVQVHVTAVKAVAARDQHLVADETDRQRRYLVDQGPAPSVTPTSRP